MKIKKPARLSMQLALSLLIMAEISLMHVLSWGLGVLLHYCFGITFNLPEASWIFLIGVLAGGAVAHFLGKWFFTPIVKLGEAMRQVAGGNFDVRLDESSRFREIREINKNFNIMAKELRATEILQTDFVTNVSHEFKTPINAIEGYAMLLQGDGYPGDGEENHYVDKILFNVRRLSKLVENILLLSKVDNQAIQKKQTRFRLDEQIRQAIVSQEAAWDKKEIEFDVDLESVEYFGNEGLLHHVWNNLLSNAIKFDPQGGSIRMRLTREEDKILFTIDDNGPGIREADKKHIFDRFFQSESSHEQEGNGLGLALVKQILKLSGGEIQAENLPAGGCRFTVTLEDAPG